MKLLLLASLWPVFFVFSSVSQVQAQSNVEFRIELGAGPSLSLPDALEDAAKSFFGPSSADSFVQISVDDIFGGMGTARRTGGASYAISLRASQTIWNAHHMSIGWDAALSFGTADYDLPQGVGPFKDPIAVDFGYIALTPRLHTAVEGPAFLTHSWVLRGGPGVEIMFADTSITSAVLDIHRTEIFETAFLFSEVVYQFNDDRASQVVLGTQYGANNTLAFSLLAGVSF